MGGGEGGGMIINGTGGEALGAQVGAGGGLWCMLCVLCGGLGAMCYGMCAMCYVLCIMCCVLCNADCVLFVVRYVLFAM